MTDLRRTISTLLIGAALVLVPLGTRTSSEAPTADATGPAGPAAQSAVPTPPHRSVSPPIALAAATTGNPFVGRPWGVYKGRAEQSWQPYANATGTTKTLLGYIALQPKAKWFGGWIPNGQIAGKVRDYITNSQAGNPDALVQMTIFRMKPWEHEACSRLPTAAEQASYKQWVDQFAAAIGNTPTAIVLQPDGPFALCAPRRSTLPSQLVAYSARVLSALPNTSVYIEAGAADWPAAGAQGGADAATRILVQGGIQYARGFALNGTHYSSTVNEVNRGVAIIQRLNALGYTGKKFVINTAQNGHPFVFGRYTGRDPDNAFVCRTKADPAARTCVTLGIPPTADVANPRWRLPASTNALARQYVDAYLWFGRPWLYRQANPFVVSRAVQLVKTTPYR